MPSRNDARQLEHLFEYHAFRRSSISSLNLDSELKSVDAIKMSLAARCRAPLYERQLSASNADSTLQIVKEQQPTSFKVKTGKPQHPLPDAVVCQPMREKSWWRMTGSNRRPPACKAGALPAELIPPEPCHASLLGTLA